MRVIRLGFVASLAPALLVAACGQDESAKKPPLVRTVTVGPASTQVQRFTGVIRARTESGLGFRVGGKIAERLVDPGQRVSAGQPLMRLERSDFSLALGSARAMADAARAQAVKAGNDEKRSRQLALGGWVSPAGYEQAKAVSDAAQAQLASAEAQAAQIANQVAYSELKADADGVVMDVSGEPGQVVSAGQPVVKLARQGPREAEIFLPEGSQRRADGDAIARLYTDRERSFPASLRELSAIADAATRTYRARYVLAGLGESAPLGATVTVELKPSLRGSDAAREVPIGAVFDSGSGTAVWKIDAQTGTVSAEPVTLMRLGAERAEILADLAEGDHIVALGAHLLKNGQQVRIAPAQVAGIDAAGDR